MLASLSNEFKVKWAALHHTHQAYLVPDLVKSFYGGPPALAIFAINARYKAESYYGSEFAPKILAEAGLNVVMKSDHPVLDSRYLVYEAAQAHHYGLNFSQALGSVTTHPARAMGMDHRLGHLRPGYDADVVIWDSFPLALGATPKQTYIDGIPQIIKPVVISKPESAQVISKPGKYDKEAAEAQATRGNPDLRPKKSNKNIIFQDVGNFYLPGHKLSMMALSESTGTDVIVMDGEISCVGQCAVAEGLEFEVIDLKGGSIAPGLITVGSHLGNREIGPEKSTGEGVGYDALDEVSELIDGLLVHGVDGAQFGGKDTL
jgi:imidazolonepropionase-like amidohydrolase